MKIERTEHGWSLGPKLTALLVVAILAAPAVWVVGQFRHSIEDYSDANRAALTDNNIAQCDRGNLQRAYELANHSDGVERQVLVRDLQPIVNCVVAVPAGKAILVTKTVQREYVAMVVNDRCWPELDPNGSGEIVGCRPLPSDSQLP